MRRVAAGVGALCVWALLASGCVRTPEPSPTPTPKPSFQCTPEAGGDAYPCDQHDYERMVQRDAQYVEAERIYRRVTEITFTLLAQKQTMSDELRSLVSGSYEERLAEELETAPSSGADYSGQPRVVWVYRAPDVANEGSSIAIRSCADSGTQKVVFEGQELPVPATQELLFYTEVDGSLRLSSSKVAEVEEC